MPPTLRELLEAPELARSLPQEAIAEVLGELVLLLARLLIQTTVSSGQAQIEKPEALDRLLSAVEVATVLGVRVSRVYEIIRQHRLPTVRVGKYLRVQRSDLRTWIDDQREEAVDAKIHPSLGSPLPMIRPITKGRGKQSR
jgi:excisionase family DNA binding protein